MSNLDSSSSDSSDCEAVPAINMPPPESEKNTKGKKRGRPSRLKALPPKLKDTLNDTEELQCDLSSEFWTNVVAL